MINDRYKNLFFIYSSLQADHQLVKRISGVSNEVNCPGCTDQDTTFRMSCSIPVVDPDPCKPFYVKQQGHPFFKSIAHVDDHLVPARWNAGFTRDFRFARIIQVAVPVKVSAEVFQGKAKPAAVYVHLADRTILRVNITVDFYFHLTPRILIFPGTFPAVFPSLLYNRDHYNSHTSAQRKLF